MIQLINSSSATTKEYESRRQQSSSSEQYSRGSSMLQSCKDNGDPVMTQVIVLVRAPPTELQVVGIHSHLMRQRLRIVARGLRNMTMNRPLYLLVANWSKAAIMLPQNITIAQCIAVSDVPWLLPVHDDNVNMAQQYKKAETKQSKLERRYIVEQDANREKKHWSEQVLFNDKNSPWKPSFLKLIEKYQSSCDGHFGKVLVAIHCIIMSFFGAAPIHTVGFELEYDNASSRKKKQVEWRSQKQQSQRPKSGYY